MNEPKAETTYGFSLAQWLYTPIDCSTLVLFRIIFSGLVLLFAILDWQEMDVLFPAAEYRPTYTLLRFTEDWPRLDLNVMFSVLCLSATAVMLGCCYRISTVVQFLVYTYIYHSDPTHYNNHYYVISLLAFWLIFVRGDAQLSIDNLWRSVSKSTTTVPRWHMFVLQLHVSMTYFFGGIVKFNSDWLQGQPLTPWLAVEANRPVIGPWLEHPQAGVIVAWIGLIFDLTIPFLLIYKPTRMFGFAGTFMFHLNNSWIFRIGIFPYMMIGTNVLYLDPDSPRKWWHWLIGRAEQPVAPAETTVSPRTQLVTYVLAFYFLLHCLMPFRHYWYAGYVEWNEEAKNFSWRMMLSHKVSGFFGVRVVAEGIAPEADFQQLHETGFRDPRRVGSLIDIKFNDRQYLTNRQKRGKGVMGNPRYMAGFARFVKAEAARCGLINPRVYILAINSLNGRPFQFLVNPYVDLSTAEVPLLKSPDWIQPLEPNKKFGLYPKDDQELKEMIVPLLQQYNMEFEKRVLLSQSPAK